MPCSTSQPERAARAARTTLRRMSAMDFVYNLIVALHLLGMAAIVGGWIAVRSGRTVIAPIVWGARAQLVTGLALVGIASAIKDDEHTVNNAKIAVKLVIAIGVLAAAEIGAACGRKGKDTGSLLDVAGGGAVVNVLVAAIWCRGHLARADTEM